MPARGRPATTVVDNDEEVQRVWTRLQKTTNLDSYRLVDAKAKASIMRQTVKTIKPDRTQMNTSTLDDMLDQLGFSNARSERAGDTINIRNELVLDTNYVQPARSQEEDKGDADREVKDDEYIDPTMAVTEPVNESLGNEPDDSLPTETEGDAGNTASSSVNDIEQTNESEQAVRYGTESKHDENPALTGGNGDQLNEVDLNYNNQLESGETDPYPEEEKSLVDIYEEMVGKYGFRQPGYGSIQLPDTVRHNWEGGAGESVEEIAMRDELRTRIVGDDDEKYGSLVSTLTQTDDFGDLQGGLDKSDLERQFQKSRRDKARGKQGKMPRLFPTKQIRQTQAEEGKPQLNNRNRYDNVALVRESGLNHMRSVSELMPSA